MKEFKLVVMTPGSTLYDGVATSIVVPTLSGYIGILPGHIPLVSILDQGEIEIKHGSEVKTIPLSGGVIDVGHDSVAIMAQ